MMNNVVIKEKEEEAKLAREELQMVQQQVEQTQGLLEKSNEEQIRWKTEAHSLKLSIAHTKREHEQKIRGIKADYSMKIDNLKFELRRINDVYDTYKEYASFE